MIQIDIEEGRVPAWFLPAPDATSSRPAPVAILFHGNGENIDDRDGLARAYLDAGVSVYLPEYRGYGAAAGSPSEAAIVADMVRFFDELLKRPEVDPARVVFHGRSLGGGVAVQVAAQRKPAALILQSSFTSAAAFAYRYYVPMFLVRSAFHSDRTLPQLDVPVLIMHGSHDSIVPVEHGRALCGMARRATYVEFDCDHNDFPGLGHEASHWDAIEHFLNSAGLLPPS